MKKKVFGRKLSRSRPAREALFSALVKSMIFSGKIVTTRAKAKAIQGDLDRMVSFAKEGSLNSRQSVLSYLDNAKEATDLLFKQIGPAFAQRTSGFTRFISLPRRKGDNAQMIRIEWTDKVEIKKEVPAVKSGKTVKEYKLNKNLNKGLKGTKSVKSMAKTGKKVAKKVKKTK